MAAAYVGARGTGSGNGFSTTITFTTTADITAGNHVVVAGFVEADAGATSFSSVTVGALSLARDEDEDPTTNDSVLEIWSARVTSLISSGATVTVTFNSGAGAARAAACIELSGIPSSSYVDASGSANNGFGSTSTSPTVANTVADAIAVAAFSSVNNVTGNSVSNGWTLGPQAQDAVDAGAIVTAYKVLAATASQSTVLTWSGSMVGDSLVVIYKGDTVAATEKVGSGVVGP